MNELALFAGAGGGILGGKLLGWRTVCAVEINPFCREVLLRRQMDGCLPRFPIWDDVQTFDGNPWRGCIDIISGGFPCQDISTAGLHKGLSGERSGLWRHYARIIGEVEPVFVFIENSPNLRKLGLSTILCDLASLGYDARWGVLGGWHCGAPHKRERMWIVATNRTRYGQTQSQRVADTRYDSALRSAPWWSVEPGLDRVVYGLANRMERIEALGNGQIPRVAQIAWELLDEVDLSIQNKE